jgi:hypothetical protein
MTTFYLDYENGNDAADGSTFALGGLPAVGPWKTITGGPTAARVAPGDIIRIAKSAAPSSIGNATWNNKSQTVTLASAQNANVDMCDVAWTAAGGATSALFGLRKEGANAIKITSPAAPAINTKYAYKALAGATDFSAYQKLTFWIYNQNAILAGHWKLCLCSDAIGAVIVDTFEISAIPSVGMWVPLTIARTGGGNLGAAIQSVALYSSTVAPPASKYIGIDDILTATTSGLNLQSLISKNSLEQGGTDSWYSIQSINSTTVLVDTINWGYYGTTGATASYKRETIKTAMAASVATVVQEIQDSGIAGSLIEFDGGYNTATNIQDGETIFDGLNSYGIGLQFSGKSYLGSSRLSFYRYNSGVYLLNTLLSELDFTFLCAGEANLDIAYSHMNTIVLERSNNGFDGIRLEYSHDNIITSTSINGNANDNIEFWMHSCNNVFVIEELHYAKDCGIYLRGSYNKFFINSAKDNVGQVINFWESSMNEVHNVVSQDNTTASFALTRSRNYFRNISPSEATVVDVTADPYDNSVGYITQFGGDPNDNRIYTYHGNIQSQTATRHTSAGLAWQFNITGTSRVSEYPLVLSVAKVSCRANELMTVKAWMKKDHATNVSCQLKCTGGQIAGVAADVTDIKADDTDWEELEITFTPTEDGVVEITAEAWYVAGLSSCYIHDVSVIGRGRILLDSLQSVHWGEPFNEVYTPDLTKLGLGGYKYERR